MKYALIVFLLLVTVSVHGQFRSTTWGMSIEEVKSTEGDDLQEQELDFRIVLTQNLAVGGKDALVAYYFIEDQLYGTRYIFSETHTNENGYINDYEDITSILDEKYTPEDPFYSWDNTLYRDDTSRWGFAISIGHLAIYNEYEDETTTIMHTLTGNNYEITHNLSYISKELKGIEEEAQKKQNISDF